MANKRISELTSITGANLADADLLVVVDVSDQTMAASGTNKKVTLEEFAQESTFSSRYVSKTDDKYVWLGAAAMAPTFGSPTFGDINGGEGRINNGAWLLDQSSLEAVAGSVVLPDFWTTFHVDLYGANAASSSGDARLNVVGAFAGDGDQSDDDAIATAVNIVAPTTAGVVKVSRFNTGVSNQAGKPLFIRALREGNDGADTLANDYGVLGLLFTRAS